MPMSVSLNCGTKRDGSAKFSGEQFSGNLERE